MILALPSDGLEGLPGSCLILRSRSLSYCSLREMSLPMASFLAAGLSSDELLPERWRFLDPKSLDLSLGDLERLPRLLDPLDASASDDDDDDDE